MAKRFNPLWIEFYDDGGPSWRRLQVDPEYKSHRAKDPAVQNQQDQERQLAFLTLSALFPFFWSMSAEADEVLAARILSPSYELPDAVRETTHPILIVSSDHDFYELLSPRVSIYDPWSQMIKTRQWFANTYPEFPPKDWAKFRALWADPSDGVRGYVGVGEVTARGHMKRKTPPGHFPDGGALWARNIKLLTLRKSPQFITVSSMTDAQMDTCWAIYRGERKKDGDEQAEALELALRKYGMQSLVPIASWWPVIKP